MCHEELHWGNAICISLYLMLLLQDIIFRVVQFSVLPPKIVSVPVVPFQSTIDHIIIQNQAIIKFTSH